MNAIQFASGTSTPVTCALHIDTGMNRLGLSATELPDLFDSDERIRLLDVRLVLSHLACADPPGDPMNDEQADRFDQILPSLIRLFPSALKSCRRLAEFSLDLASLTTLYGRVSGSMAACLSPTPSPSCGWRLPFCKSGTSRKGKP